LAEWNIAGGKDRVVAMAEEQAGEIGTPPDPA